MKIGGAKNQQSWTSKNRCISANFACFELKTPPNCSLSSIARHLEKIEKNHQKFSIPKLLNIKSISTTNITDLINEGFVAQLDVLGTLAA